MTTPLYAWTPHRVISIAALDAGLVQEGEEPNSELFATMFNRLNDVLLLLQTQGLKLWLQYNLPITLTAGVAEYTIGPTGSISMTRPMRILDDGYWLDPYGNRTPLIMMSRDDYTRLSQTVQQGAVTSFFVDKQLASMNVYFWLVPNAQYAAGTANLLIQQQAATLVSLTDAMTFPVEWAMALRWKLAEESCTGQPTRIEERCMRHAEAYIMALEDWDVEDASTSFAPDTRNNVGRRFR